MKRIAVILLSGGLDSTTVAAFAAKQGYELTGITLHYGQKHGKEIQAAMNVARFLGIRHKLVDVSFFKELAWYSALTSPERFDVPVLRAEGRRAEVIPITYVPMRNTFFITMAAAFLESEALRLIEIEHVAPSDLDAAIFIAANAIDYSGYPDCRPEYFEQLSSAVFKGSKLGMQYGRSMNIQTPVLTKTKAEIVKMAVELKAPLEYTWSCYQGGRTPCGECDSCFLRARGFVEAGYPDPALARVRRRRIAESK